MPSFIRNVVSHVIGKTTRSTFVNKNRSKGATCPYFQAPYTLINYSILLSGFLLLFPESFLLSIPIDQVDPEVRIQNLPFLGYFCSIAGKESICKSISLIKETDSA